MPAKPWVDISMDFVGLPTSKKGRDSMMWVSPETPARTHSCSKWSNDSVQDKGIVKDIECIGFEGFN
jgi:hypothetical protein